LFFDKFDILILFTGSINLSVFLNGLAGELLLFLIICEWEYYKGYQLSIFLRDVNRGFPVTGVDEGKQVCKAVLKSTT